MVNLIFVLAVTNWVIFAGTVRALSLTLHESLFVEAARCAGADDTRILGQHIMRNAWMPIIVVASQRFAQMILLEASLSFLGVGVPVDGATWGSMVADGHAQILTHNWWVAGLPRPGHYAHSAGRELLRRRDSRRAGHKASAVNRSLA